MASWHVSLEVLLLAVLLLCSLAHSSGDFFLRLLSNKESLNTTMSTSQDLSSGSSWVSTLSIGVAIGVAGTIPVAITVCCLCYVCHWMRKQLARRSVPEQSAITMTENVVYHSSGAAVPALNPAYFISSKPAHLYEKFLEDEKETSTIEGRADKGDDYYYLNNELHPEGHTNNPGRKGNNDDRYRVNISSLPEGTRPAKTSDKPGNKKIRDKDYYVNDDLFPEETQATRPFPVKEWVWLCTAQTTRKEDTRSNTSQNQSVDMAEEERKRSHGEETDSILDEDGYLKVEG